VILFLAILAGCDLTPQRVPTKPRVKPPRQAPTQAIPDAARADTGAWEEGSRLIRSISYQPTSPTAFDDITLNVVVDQQTKLDLDYAWTINGRKLLSARDPVLRHSLFKKGDEIQASVTIEKGSLSASKDGPTIIIANAPPKILTDPSRLRKLDGFRVRGEDPDGGAVTYRLDAAPPGLTVGERTGVFRYAPSATSEGGRYDIKAVIIDEDGAESTWRLAITVSGGSQSAEGKARRTKRKADWEAKRKAESEKRSATSPSEED